MINVLVNALVPVPGKERITRVVRQALRRIKLSGTISITFVNDAVIRRLNKHYRFKDKPTDVLSFPLKADDLLGDVIISVPTARRNARRLGAVLNDELERLAVHGTLHIGGYKHKTRIQRARMQRLEDRILRKGS